MTQGLKVTDVSFFSKYCHYVVKESEDQDTSPSKFRPNQSMPCGDSDLTIFGRQNYGPNFAYTSALAVRKFWSAFYPFTVDGPHVHTSAF